jgi:hypothetical protein
MACEAAGAADQLVSQRRPDWAFLGFAAPTLSLILVGLVVFLRSILALNSQLPITNYELAINI